MSNEDILEVKWPWTMLSIEVADEWIEYLNHNIKIGHPLYGKQVFPSCRREDTNETIIQFDIDDDKTYAIVNFDQFVKIKGAKMPKVEIIDSHKKLKERFLSDYLEAKEK